MITSTVTSCPGITCTARVNAASQLLQARRQGIVSGYVRHYHVPQLGNSRRKSQGLRAWATVATDSTTTTTDSWVGTPRPSHCPKKFKHSKPGKRNLVNMWMHVCSQVTPDPACYSHPRTWSWLFLTRIIFDDDYARAPSHRIGKLNKSNEKCWMYLIYCIY